MFELTRQSKWGVAIEAGIAGIIAASLAIGHDAFAGLMFVALFVALRVLLTGVEALAKTAFALGRLQGQLASMMFGVFAIGAMTAGYALLLA